MSTVPNPPPATASASDRTELTLRAILASITDHAIFTIDERGVVTSWSPGAEQVFGYGEAEIVGRDSEQLWTDEDRGNAQPAVERATARERGAAEDTRWHVARGGRPVFVTGTLRPLGEGGGFVKICRDETEKRRMEDEVAAAQAQASAAVEAERSQLAEAFRQSPSFMAILRGPEHRFQFVNDRYAQLVGDRTFVSRTVPEVLPEVVSQGFVEVLDTVFATGRPYVGQGVTVQLARQAGDGLEERVVDFVYQPTREPDGSVSGIFVHGVDVTEQARTAARITELAEQRRIALEAAQMGWWRFEPARGRVHFDARARDNHDADREVCSLEEILAHVAEEDAPRIRAAVDLATAVGDERPYAIDYRVRRSDGTMRWISSRGRTIRAGDGNRWMVGVATDITERRAAEEALRASETRFRQLADAMPQIVFAADPEGHVDYFNRQWYEYTGTPDGEVGFESWRHVHAPEFLDHVVAQWSQAVQTGGPYQIEYPLRRADGEFRWHLGRALPVRDAAGAIVRWYGTNTDIDDHKRLQESYRTLLESERAARSEAERTSRLKDEFLATFSHELRTPLNAILGWVQVLRTVPPSAEDLAGGLATIERNARAQTQIIADLLDMSAIISGKVRLEVQRVDLAAVVTAAVDTVRPTAEAKGVDLAASVALLPPLPGDPNRLQQVFWNLLSNAIKFTPAGGRVRVEAAREGGFVEIRVHDSGQGIAADFLPHVFDRFRQADASTTRRHGGLGLGLAIVKQLVELHGGGVRAHSDGDGRGATFAVTLPVSAPSDLRRTPGADGNALSPELMALRLDGRTILVVDDEPDGRSMLKHLLGDRGARVLTADSAEEAMRLLAEESVDLLISDIGMPGEDGYSLIRRVRTLSPSAGGRVPALALTAYARAQDRTTALLAGFQSHAAKPVETPELLAMVVSLIPRPGAP